MQFTLRIQCDNAAFDNNLGGELGRILRDLADRVEDASCTAAFPLRDYNGNTVGKAALT